MAKLPVFDAPFRRPAKSWTVASLARSLRLAIAVGGVLVCTGYLIVEAGKLAARLRMDLMHVEPYPVDTTWYHELEHSAVEGPIVEFSNCVDKDHIALTFDDGPSALTLALLDVFDKYNVKATFFF
ncbi:hypothetical protein Gpo141_00006121, partial [Globisporangium polare]